MEYLLHYSLSIIIFTVCAFFPLKMYLVSSTLHCHRKMKTLSIKNTYLKGQLILNHSYWVKSKKDIMFY